MCLEKAFNHSDGEGFDAIAYQLAEEVSYALDIIKAYNNSNATMG